MTEALFLADLHHPHVGDTVSLRGEEGRHAAAVRRIRVGETITISDGAGTGVRGPVTETDKVSVTIEVAEVLSAGVPDVRYHVVQALAKGDRSEQAVEMLNLQADNAIDQVLLVIGIIYSSVGELVFPLDCIVHIGSANRHAG